MVLNILWLKWRFHVLHILFIPGKQNLSIQLVVLTNSKTNTTDLRNLQKQKKLKLRNKLRFRIYTESLREIEGFFYLPPIFIKRELRFVDFSLILGERIKNS